MTNKNWQQDFYNSMKEINEIYHETLEKLEKLHQQKMELIKYHKEKTKEDEINKLRQEIKEADNS